MSKKKSKVLTKIEILRDLLFAKITQKRIPIIANLLITNRCNLKCFYCYVDVFNRQIPDLATDKILNIIDILHSHGTKIIVLLGGEPLFRNDFGTIIEHINKKKIICEVITNGYLAEKWIDYLKLADSVCISLDGDETANDLNRGKGSFKAALDAIRLLKKNGINTRIKAVITKNNVNSFDFLANFAKENGLAITASVSVVYENRDYGPNTIWLNNEEARQFLIKLKEFKKCGIPIGYSFHALDYSIKWPKNYSTIVNEDQKMSNFKYIKCRRKDFSFYMDADGTIYPCAELWGKGGGNILKDGFQNAWDSFKNYKCFCCGNIPDVDVSLLLNLNLASIINVSKYFG